MSGLWVFGYGSLMWRPGFAYDRVERARLTGAHRALCIYSICYRGTRRQPGLVCGLEPGGICEGSAFHVPPEAVHATIHYLRAREQVTLVYRETRRVIMLEDGRRVRALCFLADPTHPQYAGALALDAQARIVQRSRGVAGTNIGYVIETVRHLRELGVHDRGLERLLARIGRYQLNKTENYRRIAAPLSG